MELKWCSGAEALTEYRNEFYFKHINMKHQPAYDKCCHLSKACLRNGYIASLQILKLFHKVLAPSVTTQLHTNLRFPPSEVQHDDTLKECQLKTMQPNQKPEARRQIETTYN